MKNSKRIKRKLKKQDNKCFYCKEKLTYNNAANGKQKDTTPTIEHIYPKSNLFRYIASKLVVVCHKCNRQKNVADTKQLKKFYSSIIGSTKEYKNILFDLLNNKIDKYI